jgi:hypothetical protein
MKVRSIRIPEEIDKWIQVAGKPVWDGWVKNMQGKGYKVAPQILEETVKLGEGIEATFHDAGHVLGASMVKVR